jgi:hypothetical protein
VGTDGRHLYSANSFTLPVPDSLILRNNPLFFWKPFCEGRQWNLRVTIDRKTGAGSSELTSGCWRVISRLVDGKFPNWTQVVPEITRPVHQIDLSVDESRELSERIARLSIVKCGNHSPVVLLSDGKTLRIRWEDADRNQEESFVVEQAKVSGKPFGIALAQPLLSKALGYGLCTVQIIDELSPERFSDGNGRQMIIMPLRHGIPELEAEKTHPPQRTAAERPKHHQSAMPTAPVRESEPSPSLELAMQELIKLRETLQLASHGLKATAGLIRQARQEQRSTDREVRTVRSTIQSLKKLRL